MPITTDSVKRGESHVLNKIDIHLQVGDVQKSLGKLNEQPTVMDLLEGALVKAGEIWQPSLVYRWMECREEVGRTELTCSLTDERVMLSLGSSCSHLLLADRVILGVYTVGPAIERVAAELASQGKIFDSYVYESIALALLKKIQGVVCEITEMAAEERGWGVGPFLSPGAVTGWDLTEQIKICPLLPLDAIDVEMNENGILTPFKSVSFLVGIGSKYDEQKVGSACRVCSRKDNCDVRRLRNSQQ